MAGRMLEELYLTSGETIRWVNESTIWALFCGTKFFKLKQLLAKLRALYFVPWFYYDQITGHQSVSFELLSLFSYAMEPKYQYRRSPMMPNVINTRQVSKYWLLQRCHLCHEYAITDDEAGQSSEKLCNQQSLMSNQHFYHWWELNRITKSQLLNFAYIGEITYFARIRLLFLVVLSSEDYPS